MNDKRLEGIRRNALEALQALALPSAEQIRVTQPACITCELYEDFVFYQRVYRDTFGEELTQEQKEKLDRVLESLEAVPAEGFECFNNLALEHPRWQKVRVAASEALRELKWPETAPEPYEEIEPRVWKRRGSP